MFEGDLSRVLSFVNVRPQANRSLIRLEIDTGPDSRPPCLVKFFLEVRLSFVVAGVHLSLLFTAEQRVAIVRIILSCRLAEYSPRISAGDCICVASVVCFVRAPLVRAACVEHRRPVHWSVCSVLSAGIFVAAALID